jgi:hypothetical protein
MNWYDFSWTFLDSSTSAAAANAIQALVSKFFPFASFQYYHRYGYTITTSIMISVRIIDSKLFEYSKWTVLNSVMVSPEYRKHIVGMYSIVQKE